MEKKPTIEDLLNSLKNPNEHLRKKANGTLKNTRETWERIGRRESFAELGLERSELASFLSDWVAENPYNNI